MKVTVRYKRSGIIKTMAPQFAEVLHKMKLVDYHNPEPKGPVIKPVYDKKVMTATASDKPKKKRGRKKKKKVEDIEEGHAVEGKVEATTIPDPFDTLVEDEEKNEYETKVLTAEEK